MPAALVFVLAAACEIDRKEPAKPAHLLLLMFSAPALMALFGFGVPRCFLWLAPAVAMLLTMFFDRQIQQGYYGRVLLLLSLALAAPYSAIANVNFGTHPFKRNSVYPLSEHFGFHSQQRERQRLDHIDRPGRSLDAANEQRRRMCRILHGGQGLPCRRAPL